MSAPSALKLPAVDREQVLKAAHALKLYEERRAATVKAAPTLFDDEPVVTLVITTKRIPDRKKASPTVIPLPHPIVKEDAEFCLIAKDPHHPLKERLKQNPVPGLVKVIGLAKLRKNFKTYEARRKLAASYDVFFADDRVVTFLPGLMGKAFYDTKRNPIPVRVKGHDLGKTIAKHRAATYHFLPSGVCSELRRRSIKVGRTSMSAAEIADNVMACIKPLTAAIPGHRKNIQALHLKTTESVSLPIFNSLPAGKVAPEEDNSGKGKKRARAEQDGEAAENEGAEESDSDEVELKKPTAAASNGKQVSAPSPKKPAAVPKPVKTPPEAGATNAPAKKKKTAEGKPVAPAASVPKKSSSGVVTGKPAKKEPSAEAAKPAGAKRAVAPAGDKQKSAKKGKQDK